MEKVMANQAVKDKLIIARTHLQVGNEVSFSHPFNDAMQHGVAVGDDCAAIPDDGDYLLFAAEGMISSFLEADPWFAGYSAVMVNISDVCAMGGLPLAVTDVIWLKDEPDGVEIWAGMKAASDAYGVPIVGGHTCYRSESKQLAVAILGKAHKLLTSYDALPGDTLMMAVDMNGSYYGKYPFWNASTNAEPSHLRNILKLMHRLANDGLSMAAKDISMGGIIGTLGMLLHTSAAGAEVNLDQIPRPEDTEWDKWLTSFPSFGYLFTCKPENIASVQNLFTSASICCEAIGSITSSSELKIISGDEEIIITLK